jgi:hypothetical protein
MLLCYAMHPQKFVIDALKNARETQSLSTADNAPLNAGIVQKNVGTWLKYMCNISWR